MTLTTAVIALIGGLLPSVVWLLFWLREDKIHPEPKWFIAVSFIAGALSVIPAIYIERYIGTFGLSINWRFTLWAATEELVKVVAITIIALNSNYNDEPIDAMIYTITAALGFAAIENALFLLQPLSNGLIAQSIATNSMRFIGATLVHVVSSACIGFALGSTVYRSTFIRVISVIIGTAASIVIHASFNLSIINGGPADVLTTFMWVWGASIILIVLFEEIKAVRQRNNVTFI